MPLDQYRQSMYLDFAENYAENLAVKPCLDRHGVPWPIPYDDLSLRSPTTNELGQRLFNREIASTWGYQMAAIERPNEADWRAFNVAANSMTEPQSRVFEKCLNEVRKDQLPLSNDHTNYVNALVMDADARADDSSAVKRTARKWRECMAPLGVSDLPYVPDEMPTQSQQKAWGTYREKDGGLVTAKPSAAQLKAAVFDYDCQVTSGWLTARYDTEWDEQVKILSEYQDDIIRHKAKADEVLKKAQRIIAENAPSAP